jgi:hypothetical protein
MASDVLAREDTASAIPYQIYRTASRGVTAWVASLVCSPPRRARRSAAFEKQGFIALERGRASDLSHDAPAARSMTARDLLER